MPNYRDYRDVETFKVNRISFWIKMKGVNLKEKNNITRFIKRNKKKIDHFEYGHIPNHRVYKIVLKDGKEFVWALSKPFY